MWYTELAKLHKQYHAKGLEIINFPCSQFAMQEPQGAEKVDTCIRAKYCDGFRMMDKIKVNGADTHPIYRFLRTSASTDGSAPAIGWNFTMFLVDRRGTTVRRFPASQTPMSIVSEIESCLAEAVEE